MSLEIREWEIWHTYTTYLECCSEVDLPSVAKRLVSESIANCVVMRDGQTFWPSPEGLAVGTTHIEVDAVSGAADVRLDFAEGTKNRPDGFALEAWWQGAYFLIGEYKALGEDIGLFPNYLRAFLGKVILSASEEPSAEIHLYPILSIYESGVVILELRMISPEDSVTLAQFISGAVNLYKYDFDKVLVSPGVAVFAARAYQSSVLKNTIRDRLAFLLRLMGHDIAVKQLTREQADKDFSFRLAPLSSSEPDTLKSIALSIFSIAAVLVDVPPSPLSFLIKGQRRAISMGEYWSGRPHVHLIRFENQGDTPIDNEARFGADFARILVRVEDVEHEAARRELPQNARLLPDYGVYLRSSATLWVWSLAGLRRQERWMDANRGNLIYERQLLAETVEYGYMLHRSLYHRVEKLTRTDQVVGVRRDLVKLKRFMRELSHSGEVRELLEKGWNELGVTKLADDTEELLQLQEAETRSIDALRATRVGWALTIVFGFVAVPALAEQVILPLWELSRFHQVANVSARVIISDGIALIIVFLVLMVVLSLFSPRDA